MGSEGLPPDQLLLLSQVHQHWARSKCVWPSFEEVDKQLDRQDLDAAEILNPITPRYIQEWGGTPRRLILTARGLAQLADPPPLVDTFIIAVRFLADVEQHWEPEPPDHLEPVVTSAHLATHLQSPFPRPPEVAKAMAESVCPVLVVESGHLGTGFSIESTGAWSASVNRRIRRFRGVASLDEYLAIADAESVVPSPQSVEPAPSPTPVRSKRFSRARGIGSVATSSVVAFVRKHIGKVILGVVVTVVSGLLLALIFALI